MKKITLVLLTTVFVLSCTSSDNNDSNLPITWENIAGEWHIKQMIKPGGIKEDYQDACPDFQDYIEFYAFDKVRYYRSYDDACNEYYVAEHCSDYYFVNANTIGHCGKIVDGIITTLTHNAMEIKYGEVRNFSYPNFGDNITGIVLERKE